MYQAGRTSREPFGNVFLTILPHCAIRKLRQEHAANEHSNCPAGIVLPDVQVAAGILCSSGLYRKMQHKKNSARDFVSPLQPCRNTCSECGEPFLHTRRPAAGSMILLFSSTSSAWPVGLLLVAVDHCRWHLTDFQLHGSAKNAKMTSNYLSRRAELWHAKAINVVSVARQFFLSIASSWQFFACWTTSKNFAASRHSILAKRGNPKRELANLISLNIHSEHVSAILS